MKTADEILAEARALTTKQAKDTELWLGGDCPPLVELRRLTEIVEQKSAVECALKALGAKEA